MVGTSKRSASGRSPRRILMTADCVGGVWTYALELSEQMAERGIEVGLATFGAPLSTEQRRAAETVCPGRVFESRYKCEWMQEPWEEVEACGRWLQRVAGEFVPDLIHFNHYAHAAGGWEQPVVVVAHSCVSSWWRAVKGEPAPEEWNRYRATVRSGVEAADAVVAPSRAMLQALVENYGEILTRCEVIPNGRKAALFPPGAKEEFILLAGRLWDEAKNVGAVARVAAELDWPVCVAGEERHPDGGLFSAEAVKSVGRLSPLEMAQWLGRASIFVSPARYEPFGLSILEAGLAGCALVLGDIPSLREIWGEAARYVAPGDPGSIRDELRELIANPLRRVQLAARARARALEFSSQQMGERYVRLYADLATNQGEGSAARQRRFLCV